MKKNEKKVPAFDEIIFENRNKEYGAYDLRKQYKTTTSLSILGAVAISVIVVLSVFFNTEEVTATKGKETIFIIDLQPEVKPITTEPVAKAPKPPVEVPSYSAPEVTDDTTVLSTFGPSVDDLLLSNTNGNVTDTIIYANIPPEVVPVAPEPFIIVQEPPSFPGGLPALYEYVYNNIEYPSEAIRNNLQGRVTLKFVVDSDGSVNRIEVMKSVDPLLDQEAMRVVGILPRFNPGKQGGVPVPVWFTLPVLFKIDNNR